MMTCLLETIAELGNRERCRLYKTIIDCKLGQNGIIILDFWSCTLI